MNNINLNSDCQCPGAQLSLWFDESPISRDRDPRGGGALIRTRTSRSSDPNPGWADRYTGESASAGRQITDNAVIIGGLLLSKKPH